MKSSVITCSKFEDFLHTFSRWMIQWKVIIVLFSLAFTSDLSNVVTLIFFPAIDSTICGYSRYIAEVELTLIQSLCQTLIKICSSCCNFVQRHCLIPYNCEVSINASQL
ncbi:hypothetical protein NPIL_246221 [Nephila pilipes]|uniref:Uncharacterized protein n=1 Tax=Nephila pilipes TaxID=299642 RepID=A0A8X6N4T2_NEPPI|nr:hypothetical protein NPIL_246221 [Nephila pilipes]